MKLLKTAFESIFGRKGKSNSASETEVDKPSSGFVPEPDSEEPSAARVWLKEVSERDFVWKDLGVLAVPSQELFVSDPACGSDYHMRHTASVEAVELHIWVLESGLDHKGFHDHTNGLVWLEANGNRPFTRGTELGFSVGSASLGIGNIEAGQAFTRLTDYELDAGRGDSFDWISPFLQEKPHFARWLEIPPDRHRIFVASTSNDGGFAAVWLHDAHDLLSGVLIDIAGRASDRLFLDKLLPDRS
ncbi:hypothetical protein [Tritonibacter mobilis]|uniref:hypothetical protein n=1 Tax=Tritonibacter mobilis TaxID=379347 RepID=UPI000E0D9D35|nr:hypothetical protein [Tritonibacter mobilis]